MLCLIDDYRLERDRVDVRRARASRLIAAELYELRDRASQTFGVCWMRSAAHPK